MQANIEAFGQHKSAHHIYMHLLDPYSTRHLPPHALKLLKLPTRTLTKGFSSKAAAADAEETAEVKADDPLRSIAAADDAAEPAETSEQVRFDCALSMVIDGVCNGLRAAWKHATLRFCVHYHHCA